MVVYRTHKMRETIRLGDALSGSIVRVFHQVQQKKRKKRRRNTGPREEHVALPRDPVQQAKDEKRVTKSNPTTTKLAERSGEKNIDNPKLNIAQTVQV